MDVAYKEYLTAHINGVSDAFNWLQTYLPEVVEKCSSDITETIAMHDRSKYSDEEYTPYLNYFYGTKTKAVEAEFNYAWLHHIHANPHHWQHWVLKHDDEPEEALDMPYDYIVEMVCDHWSFSWKTGNLYEIFNWYKAHKGMVVSEKTRKTYEDILDKIKRKLDSLQ